MKNVSKRQKYLFLILGFFSFFTSLISLPVYSQSLKLQQLRYLKDCPLDKKEQKEVDELLKNRELEQDFKINPKKCYERGIILNQMNNVDLAKRAFKLGCEDKFGLSCDALARMYEAESDHDLAIKYYQEGCSYGMEQSCLNEQYYQRPSNLLKFSAIGLIGIAVFIIVWIFLIDESEYRTNESLDNEDEKTEGMKNVGIILKASRPIFKRYITPIVSQMKGKKKFKEKYKRVLASAGLNTILSPEDFYSFKIFMVFGLPVLFLAVRTFLGTDWPLNLVFVIPFAGFFYPDSWIKGVIELRQKEIRLNMPFAVDMLALSVEAGLDFSAAMVKVIEKAKKSALTDEFENFIKETRLGSSRAEALRNMAWRIDMIQVSSFCATLIAADSVGASVAPILKELSKEMRQKKSAEIEKEGAKASTKILGPMMLLIVPAVFIVIIVPLAFSSFR